MHQTHSHGSQEDGSVFDCLNTYYPSSKQAAQLSVTGQRTRLQVGVGQQVHSSAHQPAQGGMEQ